MSGTTRGQAEAVERVTSGQAEAVERVAVHLAASLAQAFSRELGDRGLGGRVEGRGMRGAVRQQVEEERGGGVERDSEARASAMHPNGSRHASSIVPRESTGHVHVFPSNSDDTDGGVGRSVDRNRSPSLEMLAELDRGAVEALARSLMQLASGASQGGTSHDGRFTRWGIGSEPRPGALHGEDRSRALEAPHSASVSGSGSLLSPSSRGENHRSGIDGSGSAGPRNDDA